MKKPVSLRSALTGITIIVTVVALIVSSALVALTTILHQTTVRSGKSVESVRLAEEAQIALLLLERARDPIVKRDIEGDLRRKLLETRRLVSTEQETRLLGEAEKQVDSHLAVSRDPRRNADERAGQQELAYDALGALVSANVAKAKKARQDAARWNTVGNTLGVAVATLFVAVAGGLLLWLRGRAFEPLFGLASAMERFVRGDRGVRAAEDGPRELREMCARFNEMASAIAAQRQAQIAFLGGIAHDLRSPLSALRLSVAQLAPDKPLPPQAKLGQTLAMINRQIARMDRMLADTLDLAKLEAGYVDLRLDRHDARKLIAEVVELLEPTSQAHRLEVRVPDEVTPITCDDLRIERVITNLISNAIKYSPARSTIEVAVEPRGHELELSVADQGAGISLEDRDYVFEPFRRVGPSRDLAPGAGLGLFVVRKIVEAHHGRIEIESTPGKGSTFRVFLPMERDLAEPGAAIQDDEPRPFP